MYLVLFFLSLIGGWWLFYRKRSIELKPLETIFYVVLIIGGIFAIIASIPTTVSIIKNPIVWNSGIFQIIFAISLMIVSLAIPLIFFIFLFKVFQVLYNKLKKSNLTVSLMKESKPSLDGDLLFEGKFTSYLTNGYFTIHIRSPFWEEETTFIRRDNVKNLGQLQGQYIDRPIKLKCHIPKNFTLGEYNVTIGIFDVVTWVLPIRTTHKIITQKLKIEISESKN